MTILDPLRTAQQERTQRRATLIFMLLLGLVAIACLFFALVILIPKTRILPVGTVSEFPLNQPTERAVPQLSISAFIRLRPQLSQDIIFITRRSDETWQALLGSDIESGCFLVWSAEQQRFKDGCSGRTYDAAGRNLNPAARTPHMAHLPVQIEQGQVFIVDRLCTETRPCR